LKGGAPIVGQRCKTGANTKKTHENEKGKQTKVRRDAARKKRIGELALVRGWEGKNKESGKKTTNTNQTIKGRRQYNPNKEE